MQDFFADLYKPSWWISTFIGCFVITWFANWCKSKVEKFPIRIAKFLIGLSAKQKAIWHKKVNVLALDEAKIVQIRHEILIHYLECIMSTIGAIAFVAIALLVAFLKPMSFFGEYTKLYCLLCVFVALVCFINAMQKHVLGSYKRELLRSALSTRSLV